MSSTLMPERTATTNGPDWGAISDRLVAAFPLYSAKDVLTELVHAHQSALYVGTAEEDLGDVVELMAVYAMRVRCGQITPSGRIAPETRNTQPRETVSHD